MVLFFEKILNLFIFSVFTYFVSQSTAEGKFTFAIKKNNFLIYNFLCIIEVYYFFQIIINRNFPSKIITSLLFFVISLTMYYVHEFRGTNINFSDILSLNTAKEVAGGYTYKVKPIFVVFAIYYIISIIAHFLNNKINLIYGKTFHFEFEKEFNIPFTGRLTSILLFLIIFFILKSKINAEKYDYSLNAGEKVGYIYNFFSSIPIFHKKYATTEMLNITSKKYVERVASKNKLFYNNNFTNYSQKIDYNINRPHVIVIMNESFGSVHENIKTNAPVTPYFDSLANVMKGNLYVNTFGGGTANTEFEFLTGMSIGNYEYPVMPYNNFVKRDKYSLARYFRNIGYRTKAFHPYTATNYHRDFVYKKFGFDDLIFFDDTKHREYVRNFISDEAFYKEVIDIYENSIKNNEKLFLFGITMQNHSGYSNLNDVKIKAQGISENEATELNSYLTLMNISDNALHVLFDYFRKVNEEVIILFFGDHNASFGTKINKIVYENSDIYECTNTYRTPFFIYSNKKKLDKYVDRISANFLSLLLLDEANLPYDELHNLLKKVYSEFSVYNFHKAYSGLDNKLHNIPYDTYMMLERKYLM